MPDNIFSNFVNCPKCNSFWVKEYGPEFCPECGSRVSDQAGRGMEDMVELIEEVHAPINILQCPNCKLRYPHIEDKRYRICFRCQIPLVNATPVRNILRRMRWHSRRIGKLLKGNF